MREDQLQKLRNHSSSPTHKDQLFLLSWTLTQQKPADLRPEDWLDPAKAIAKLLPWLAKLKAIRVMAYSANKSLMVDLLAHVNAEAFPNILYVDYIQTRDCAALAMAVNYLVYGNDL
ncbi:hypothetical protein MMC18_002772 [Xylographa bjoerkii]|nr:hypothetical protein [Xylographa bjoerkii]